MLFNPTRPTRHKKSKAPKTVKVSQLRHKLRAKIRSLETEENRQRHEAATQRKQTFESKLVQNNIGKPQKGPIKNVTGTFLRQQSIELQAGPTVDEQEEAQAQTQQKKQSKLQTNHIRTVWYMAPVDGISTQPTALGRIPLEYYETKYFVPDPTITPSLAQLTPKQQSKIHKVSFEHLQPNEQERALNILNLPRPEDLHPNEPFPHVHYVSIPRLKDKSPFQLLRLHLAEVRAFRSPKLAVTAFSINQVPRLRHHTRDVEIVFVGRSNVGKSSLINALSHSDVAKTGRTPGKTQSLNFYALHPESLRSHRNVASSLARASQIDTDRIYGFVQKLDPVLTLPLTKTQETSLNDVYKRAGNGPVMMLVDVPGYGHANAPDWITDKWNVMLGSYLRLRSPLNFPLDQPDYWTTQEYHQELKNLRKNRARPRKKIHSKQHNENNNNIDDDNDDNNNNDEDDTAWQSDVEIDDLSLFSKALTTHVETMKKDMASRITNYEEVLRQFEELEKLENLVENPSEIQSRRIALLELQAKLQEQLSTDPLNASVTNLPRDMNDTNDTNNHTKDFNWCGNDKIVNNDMKQNVKKIESTTTTTPPASSAMSRYKRLATLKSQPTTTSTTTSTTESSSTTTATIPQSTESSTNTQQSTESPPTISESTPTVSESTTPITPRPLLRLKPRISTPIIIPNDSTTSSTEGPQIRKAPRIQRSLQRQTMKQQQLTTNTSPIPMARRSIKTKSPYQVLQGYLNAQKMESQFSFLHTKNGEQKDPTALNPLHSRLPPLDHLGHEHGSPLKLVVVLLDARAGVTKYDLQFLNFLEKFHISHQVVLTKIDKLTPKELEGAAYSISQSLFPHEYVKILTKTQPLLLSAFPNGKLPINSPPFTIKSNEQDKLWEQSIKYQPRKFCSPLLIGVSSEKHINIDVLQKSILHGIFERI